MFLLMWLDQAQGRKREKLQRSVITFSLHYYLTLINFGGGRLAVQATNFLCDVSVLIVARATHHVIGWWH